MTIPQQPFQRFLFDLVAISMVFFFIKCLLAWSDEGDSFALVAYFKSEWKYVLLFGFMMAVIRFFQRRSRIKSGNP